MENEKNNISQKDNKIVYNNLEYKKVSEEQRKSRIDMRMKSKKNKNLDR